MGFATMHISDDQAREVAAAAARQAGKADAEEYHFHVERWGRDGECGRILVQEWRSTPLRLLMHRLGAGGPWTWRSRCSDSEQERVLRETLGDEGWTVEPERAHAARVLEEVRQRFRDYATES